MSVFFLLLCETESNLTRKGFVLFTPPHHSLSLEEARGGTQRQELKHKPWRNAAYRLTRCGFHSLLFHTHQDYLPRDSMTIVGWALPHQSPIKKKCFPGLPTCLSHGTNFSLEVVLSSQMTLPCVKFTNKQTESSPW